jgi:hypothetical protein
MSVTGLGRVKKVSKGVARTERPDRQLPLGASWSGKCVAQSADAIERQLAHVDADSVRRAYARANYWEERVHMMAWWADRCAEMQAGAIVARLRA